MLELNRQRNSIVKILNGTEFFYCKMVNFMLCELPLRDQKERGDGISYSF